MTVTDALESRIRQRAEERWRQTGGAYSLIRFDEHVRRTSHDIQTTREALLNAPGLELVRTEWDRVVAVADMRREEPWPELPLAAVDAGGVSYVAGPIRDASGRRMLVCSGSVAEVDLFVRRWAPVQGLIDVCCPAPHTFASGYLP